MATGTVTTVPVAIPRATNCDAAPTATPRRTRATHRLVVPAELRAGGGFDQGDVLVLIDSPGGVVMVSRDRLRDLVRRDLADHDLVDDLIKDRREAARREDTE